MQVNRELGRELAEQVIAQPKECWRNSVLALNSLPESATYVEGLLNIADCLWIEHGWLESGDEIIDPTLDDQEAKDYHAIFRYTWVQVWGRIRKGRNREMSLPLYASVSDDQQTIHQWAMNLNLGMIDAVEKTVGVGATSDNSRLSA